MSIIHDALKKVQQEQTQKADETSTAPATTPATTPLTTGYIYATPEKTPSKDDQHPIEHLQSKQNKAKSVLAFLCALALFLGSLIFLYKQLNTYFPHFNKWVKSSYYKLINKKEPVDHKAAVPAVLKPLAQLTINPTAVKGPQAVKPALVTLNIHGIMANGKGNLVLINDQVYQEGDEVDGAKIVKINLNSITVIINGTEQTISVKG